MKTGHILGAALFAAVFAADPALADDVKVGAIYPLSGNAASAGKSELDAVALAVELVNTVHHELSALPSVGKGGLSNLGGAKIQLISADHQGKPEEGQSQTLRLITQEHVAAIIGAYHSNVSFTATAVSERQGIPFVVSDSVAANITSRGFKWLVRVTPVASDFAKNYMEYLGDMKKAGHKVETVAVVNENTDYGTSVGGTVVAQAKSHGFEVVAQIPYNANSSDVSAQVLQLKEKNPDCVIFVSYTADAILYMLFLLGVLVYLSLIKHVMRGPMLSQILSTFGLALLLRYSAFAYFKSDFRTLPESWLAGTINVSGIYVGKAQLVAGAIAGLLALGMHVLLTRTALGSRLLAVAEYRNAAMLMGIRPDRMQALAWGLSAASAGVAGALLANVYPFSPEVGQTFALTAFVVVALGGFGSVPGAMIAGTAIGLIEQVAAYGLGPIYKDVVVYGLFVAVLWVRPQGLLGKL